MAKNEAVSLLFDFFKLFLIQKTDADSAIELLTNLFNDPDAKLTNLLVEYHENDLVIKPLLAKTAPIELVESLLIKLFEINPLVLLKPIKLGKKEQAIVISHLINYKKYHHVLGWISEHHQDKIPPKHLEYISFINELNKPLPQRKEKEKSMSLATWLSLDAPDIPLSITIDPSDEAIVTRGPPSLPTCSTLIQTNILNELAILDHPLKSISTISPYINITMMVESIILDAFLSQTFYDRLMSQGILLFSTVRHSESLKNELLGHIQQKKPILLPDLVDFIENRVESILKEKTPTKSIDCVLIPINHDNTHYGLLILYLKHPKIHAVYIDPISAEHKWVDLNDTKKPLSAIEKKLYPQVSHQLFNAHLKKLVQELPLDENDVQFIHLAQDPSTSNHCSDYLIAVIALIALNKIDLINSAESIHSITGQYLHPDDATFIRFLEIQRFGKPYFLNQLHKQHDPHQMSKMWDKISQIPVQKPKRSKPILRRTHSGIIQLPQIKPEDLQSAIAEATPKSHCFENPRILFKSQLPTKSKIKIAPKPNFKLRRDQIYQPSPLGNFMQTAQDICDEKEQLGQLSTKQPIKFKIIDNSADKDNLLTLPQCEINFSSDDIFASPFTSSLIKALNQIDSNYGDNPHESNHDDPTQHGPKPS